MFFVLNLETLYISYLHPFVGTSEEISRGDRWVIEASAGTACHVAIA
ncbi:hypothetical protein [Nostoc sp.]